jgi:hypothetical protein
MCQDAWDNDVTVCNNFLTYRMRSIDISSINEMKVKGKRFYINHYKENTCLPKMCVICKNNDKAVELHNYVQSFFNLEDDDDIHTSVSNQPEQRYITLFEYLFCSRR